MFLKVWPQNILSIRFCIIFRGEQLSEKWSPDESGPIFQKFESLCIWTSGYLSFFLIMEFDLKWVHMARYELILKLDGAL